MESKEILERLAAPFPPERVKWRVGDKLSPDRTRGQALCYIEVRDVMRRLDEVLGIEGWEDDYQLIEMDGVDGNRIVGLKCTLKVRIDGRWVAKTGTAETTDIQALKGAESDALKRAAVKFGIFRYAYDIPAPWVPVEQGSDGGYYIAGPPPQLPDFALPGGQGAEQQCVEQAPAAAPAPNNGTAAAPTQRQAPPDDPPDCMTPIERSKIEELFGRVAAVANQDSTVFVRAHDWLVNTPGFQDEVRAFALRRLRNAASKRGVQLAA